MRLAERLLLALSRDPQAPDYAGKTLQYTMENALEFCLKTIPNFKELVRDKVILDFGCGPGWPTVAMRTQCGARRVVGVDINPTWISMSQALAEKENVTDTVSFGYKIPYELNGSFDLVISISAFEHFDDPALRLREMRSAVKPGGLVVITFAEPWWSHAGSHMGLYTRLPWVNVWFSERTALNVRSHFRTDGAKRYEEVEGGLNRMTLAKFERIIKASDMTIEQLKFHTTKGIPLVDKIPIVREFWVSAATCFLRR
jgi:SAM-dependent methyltransferase